MSVAQLWALRLAGPVAGRFPSLAYPVARAGGRLTALVRPATRRGVEHNLALAGMPPGQLRAGSRRVFERVASYWVDEMTMPYRNTASIERDHLRIVNEHFLAPLLAPGPVLIASAHTGNAEFALHAVTNRGRDYVAMVLPLDPPALTNHMLRLRNRGGARYVLADAAGVRACLATLREGGVAGMMADIDYQGTGICVDLLGTRLRLPRGPWLLARRTGVTVLPVFALRRKDDHFVVRCYEGFRVEKTADEAADITCAARQWAAAFEDVVRRYPAQWFVLRDVAKEQACAAS